MAELPCGRIGLTPFLSAKFFSTIEHFFKLILFTLQYYRPPSVGFPQINCFTHSPESSLDNVGINEAP
jgi:hypothetical protein